MFSDVPYGTIDFVEINNYLEEVFSYVDPHQIAAALGKLYRIGNSWDESVKLDIFYTDDFIFERWKLMELEWHQLKRLPQ
ncbi:hypothetical protein SAMN05443429_106161 [Cruoricaptor ignavus]|uniref:Uncharacterized protein n=1 Tax=Cruoricaptor ignavus TaxID=1118202 RepID=A0A1M6FAG2_9FLAO|nr:hypothetical protein [Cruoricaptor ignavus]SHI94665.1 hypothetical protein SAMN05443429_106161 [Cruoricaptor ignavus]